MDIIARKKSLLAIFSLIVLSFSFQGYAYSQQIHEQENATEKRNKKDYYSKIIQNEIEILKYQSQEKEKNYSQALEKQKNDYEKKLAELEKKLAEVEQQKAQKSPEVKEKEAAVSIPVAREQGRSVVKTATAEEKLEFQRQIYEQALLEKDKETDLKIKKITEEYDKKQQELESSLQNKLTEKYKKLDEALREKELSSAANFVEKDNTIKQLQADSENKETLMRQALAKRETELIQQFEREKNKLTEENEALKKSSEQSRIYLLKLKEESELKDTIIREKNDQIEVLNKKMAFFSGDEAASELKTAQVMKEEIEVVKNENNRLKQELDQGKNIAAQLKEEYEKKLLQQKNSLANAENQLNVNMEKNSTQWQKKLNIVETRYEKEIGEINKKHENEIAQYQEQQEKTKEELRAKILENESLKLKINSSRDNQVYLLEMLANKAARMTKAKEDSGAATNKAPQTMKSGFEKEEAKSHFDKAMQAVMEKNYVKAKNEIEQALTIEPNNESAKNVLLNVNFLLEKKK